MPAITVENVSKKYRKGQFGYRTLREDLYNLTGQLIHLRRGDRKSYGERYMWALRDVCFQVEKGERLGIIGANGSGKTTLLRLLAGITSPTEGSISLKGRMGVLIELMAGFHPELTGRENIYLNGAIMGLSRKEIRRKFDDIISFAEIEDWVDTPIKRYSSGMHVRLGFAVAAHLDPDILLVDEVLAVGDAAFQEKCLRKMETAAGEGRTVVFVSHNMTSVSNLCDRGIWLDQGQIRSDGITGQVIEQYLSHSQQGPIQERPGEYDLTNRNNPYMKDKLIVRRVRLLDAKGNPRYTFLMGHEMTVEIEVEGLSDYRDTLVGVIFTSRSGQRLAAINTGMTCSHVDQPRRRRELAVLRVPQIPFTPASYWIDVIVSRHSSGRVDYAHRAVQFAVAEADVYGTGYQLVGDYGIFYLNATWEIRRHDSLD